ncbi:MAG: type II toxin-antitoxin system PemK/MazF family toxin [Marinifilaceae bacterium]
MQFKVFIVNLDPTKGSEMKKTRPCVVISPDVMNLHLKTVIIAPLTSTIKEIPFRPITKFNDNESAIALDQMRSVDKTRLIRCIGKLNTEEVVEAKSVLSEMFR